MKKFSKDTMMDCFFLADTAKRNSVLADNLSRVLNEFCGKVVTHAGLLSVTPITTEQAFNMPAIGRFDLRRMAWAYDAGSNFGLSEFYSKGRDIYALSGDASKDARVIVSTGMDINHYYDVLEVGCRDYATLTVPVEQQAAAHKLIAGVIKLRRAIAVELIPSVTE